MGEGEDLNERVWRIFDKAGFTTEPCAESPSEHLIDLGGGKTRTVDLFAEIPSLGVKIIGENKSGSLKASFTNLVNDYLALKDKDGANTVLFVITKQMISVEDRCYAQENGMRVWTENELDYYELLVETIGKFAKYELINSFGLSTKEQTYTAEVLAIKLKQPSTSGKSLFLFTMNPTQLLRLCVVLRKAQGDASAYQRILQRDRLTSIGKFVSTEDALLPTDIVVNLNDSVNWKTLFIPEKDTHGQKISLTNSFNYELGVLQIPMKYGSLEIIDGQHRLFGFINSGDKVRENFNLIVVGLQNIEEKLRINTFVAINDKAKRMDANLVSYLKYTNNDELCMEDPSLMAIRIVVDLNKQDPFKDRIRLVDLQKNEKITLKGFAGYDLRNLLGPKGLIRYYYGNDYHESFSCIRMYFSIIKSEFHKQWISPGKYIIFTNRGISAFLKLLKSILKYENHKLSKQDIEKYMIILKQKKTDRDWEISSLQNSYVGSKGWIDFHKDLVKIIQASIPEFTE